MLKSVSTSAMLSPVIFAKSEMMLFFFSMSYLMFMQSPFLADVLFYNATKGERCQRFGWED